MPQLTLNLDVEELKALILQLPAPKLLELVDMLEERVETLTMMQLAETGFREWHEPEEDLYDVQA
ncbi:MAG: hypothetical protein ACK4HB_02785 [Candidatus Bipolaricaulia bacterium]